VPRLAAIASGCLLLAGLSLAADYPTHPVRIIIGFGPGSAADTPARLLAQKLGDSLGQQFLVENKPGAGSNLAAEYVAHAPNDGYTLMMATTAQVLYAGTTNSPTYDVIKDFAPIVCATSIPLMLVANPEIGVSNLKDLIALVKQKPNQIFFASSGVGTAAHVAGELINMMAGIKLGHVPYQGSAQALTDVVTGRVQLWIAPASALIQQVETGKLTAIAVTTAQRAGIAPAVPTMAEAGLPGYDLSLWFGLLAPAGTPKPVVDRLAQIANDALRTPELAEPLHKIGMEIVGGTPEEFSRSIGVEVKKATDVATAANIRQ
jgi:tripartite-type tricarboxylate transporter receptor subunit TctC